MNEGTDTRDFATLEEQVRVRAEGFTTLSQGGQRPMIDIVFIHGLGGHPESTWTSTEADPEETQTSTLNDQTTSVARSEGSRKTIFGIKLSKKPKKRRQTKFFWPYAQLAKDFPEARILTYGYDCSVIKLFEAADRRGIKAHGDDLLGALNDQRDSRNRPIIFVVHSLGGLILKQALWASHESTRDNVKKVYESTIGILFYGTPHRGGNYSNLGEALACIVKRTGHTVSTQIMENLKHDSEILEILRENFLKMLDANQLDVYSFYETKGLAVIHGFDRKVVDKTSATLEHRVETIRSAPGNHMEMCKFTGPKDHRYEAVKVIVRDLLASDRVQGTQEITNCISSLEVAEMDNDRAESRLHNIIRRHQGTLDWLFQLAVTCEDGRERSHGLLPWIQGGKGIYWISGIPASGKSTAMKYIHYWMKSFPRKQDHWLHVAVFFHDRGTNEQKTMLGMLRSILRQLISSSPESWRLELTQLIVPFGRLTSRKNEAKETKRRGVDDWLWTVEKLQEAIIAVATQKRFSTNVFLMVDALDEHNGNHEEMIRFLQDLAAPTEARTFKFQILLASRPDPPFNDLLRSYPHLNIHEWTEPDVKAFITSSFRYDQSFQVCLEQFHDRRDFPELEATIIRRARGVFLWVRLIVEDMMDEVKRRRIANVSDLSKRLAKLPDDLVDLYTRILKRVPSDNSIETYILLETVLRARRPLTVLELAYVLMLGLDKIDRKLDEQGSLELRLDEPKIDLIEKMAWSYLDRILCSCKGLLQVYGRYTEHPWLDENESMWSAPPFQPFVYPTQLPIDETEMLEQPFDDPVIINLARRDRTNTTLSEISLPQRDSLKPYDKCPEARWHVQLLHQSVKEYMLKDDGRNLDYLFQRPDTFDIPTQRPAENGHVFILDMCVQFLRAKPSSTYKRPSSGPKHRWPAMASGQMTSKLTPGIIAEWVLHHGVNTESTMHKSFMLTLDKADHYLQIELGKVDWPAQAIRLDRQLKVWNFNFIAYAVGADMRHYVENKLRQQPDIITTRKGRPLLFFAIWTPGGVGRTEPKMVQMLLDHGADVRAKWVDGESNEKDALRSMQFQECDKSGYPLKEIMLLLLKKGADPNLSVVITRKIERPLTHQAIMMDISAEAKMDILRELKQAGARFDAQDSERLRVLDVYLQWLLGRKIQDEFSITQLEWILQSGARISAGMFNSDGFKRTLLYAEELRRPSYYTYYGRKAAHKDNSDWPAFSFTQQLGFRWGKN